MKLASLLKVLPDEQVIEVQDINSPIDCWELFAGSVKECRRQWFRNGVIQVAFSTHDVLSVLLDVEYQKKHRGNFNEKTVS